MTNKTKSFNENLDLYLKEHPAMFGLCLGVGFVLLLAIFGPITNYTLSFLTGQPPLAEGAAYLSIIR